MYGIFLAEARHVSIRLVKLARERVANSAVLLLLGESERRIWPL